MAGGGTDEDGDGGDEMAGGDSDEDEDGGDEMAGGDSDEDEDGGDEMAGGDSDEDEDGGDEMAGGDSDKDDDGGDEMASGNNMDKICENGNDYNNNAVLICNQEGARGEVIPYGNSSRNKKCLVICNDDRNKRFEYTHEIYEAYLPTSQTTESSKPSPVILQTVPHYTFSNFYTLNKHNHHHLFDNPHLGTPVREHLPLDYPASLDEVYNYRNVQPPKPSKHDLYQRIRSLPTLFRYPPPNENHILTHSSPPTYHKTGSDFIHNSGFDHSSSLLDARLKHNVQEYPVPSITIPPKTYYSTTKERNNLYPSPSLFPKHTPEPVYRFENFEDESRKPKSYDSGFSTSVYDNLLPISIKNHGINYGMHNKEVAPYHIPTPTSLVTDPFSVGKGFDLQEILPHLLPPHMTVIQGNKWIPPLKVDHQTNSFHRQQKMKPIVRFQYIHHSGPHEQKETYHEPEEEYPANKVPTPHTYDEPEEEDYPAYKIPGPPYHHHNVPIEKQKKRKGKLYKLSSILKKFLGR